MNYLDFILIIPIALGAFSGFKKGLILEVFSLLALFAGIYVGIHFSDFAADFLRNQVQLKSEYVPIAAFILTFVAVLVGVYFLGKTISTMIKMVSLELFNKILGAAFSAVKSLLILSISLMCLNALNIKFGVMPKKVLEESLFYEPLTQLPIILLPVIEESPWYEQFEDWRNEKLEVR